MKRFIAAICILALFTISTVSAQHINFSSQSPDLNICGATDTFSVVIQNTSSDTLNNPLVIINFHNGVAYQNSSLSGTGFSEQNVANPDSVVFSGSPILPFATRTFSFLASAHCDAADSSAVMNSIRVLHSQGTDVTLSAPYNILTAALSVQSIVPASFTGPLGSTFSRCITVINGGFGALSTFSVAIERDAASLLYTNFILSANNSALVPTLSGDSIIFNLTTAQIQALGDLDTLFEQNEVLEICYDINVVDCINLSSEVSTWWGCNGDTCERQTTAANVIVPALVPNLVAQQIFIENRCYGGPTPSLIKIVVTNTGTGAARDVLLDIWQGGINGPSSGYYSRLDTTNIQWVDSSGNVQILQPTAV
ncbi:MAG TPA: hypothetical protein ENJ82_14630, partial [Bacteroidetes bacterium]|nr:hypothetical protein [Bacteroidota bacterium]